MEIDRHVVCAEMTESLAETKDSRDIISQQWLYNEVWEGSESTQRSQHLAGRKLPRDSLQVVKCIDSAGKTSLNSSAAAAYGSADGLPVKSAKPCRTHKTGLLPAACRLHLEQRHLIFWDAGLSEHKDPTV